MSILTFLFYVHVQLPRTSIAVFSALALVIRFGESYTDGGEGVEDEVS